MADTKKRVITAEEMIKLAEKSGNREVAIKMLGRDRKIKMQVIDIRKDLFVDRKGK